MSDAQNLPSNGLSYKQAGVDIDAGNALVEAIKPLVRSTRRPGADAEIGGFGGLFDLKAAGFKDPILVAANDGVGTKVKIAIDTGIHDTIGIDRQGALGRMDHILVPAGAMCAVTAAQAPLIEIERIGLCQ